jgi:hypothetical protein
MQPTKNYRKVKYCNLIEIIAGYGPTNQKKNLNNERYTITSL